MEPIGMALVTGVGVASLATASLGRRSWRLVAAWAAALLALAATARLAWAFAAEDWRLLYVVDNTRPGLAWPLRVAGLWAGPDGSLLLWTTMLAVATTAVAARAVRRRGPALMGGLTAAYATVVAVVANPFELLPTPPSAGLGLQPVLEHEAMTWHPPALYAGLIAAVAAGALTLSRPEPTTASSAPTSAADAESATGTAPGTGAEPGTRTGPAAGAESAAGTGPAAGRPTGRGLARRTWAVVMVLLTIGLVTGSRWAHVELGWGGYWAWDPIENAGLVVWLIAAAAVHRPTDRRIGALAVVAALWATTVTRIGVVTSVHAFADDAPLRLGLLTVAGIATAAVAALVATDRSATSHAAPSDDGMRAGAVAGRRPRTWAAVGTLVAAVVVAAGTYEPAVEAAIGGDAVAIAGHYYTRSLFPVVLAAVAACLVADRRPVAAGIGAVAGIVVVGPAAGVYAMVVGAAGGAIAGSALSLRGRPGRLAHIGLGLLLVGVAGTFASQTIDVAAPLGQEVTLTGFGGATVIKHRGIELGTAPGITDATAEVVVDGRTVHPRLVAYTARSRTTSEMDEIHRAGSLFGTTQILLVDGDATTATYRLHWHPRIGLVWLGAAVLVAGSALALGPQQLFQRRAAAVAGTVVDPATAIGS